MTRVRAIMKLFGKGIGEYFFSEYFSAMIFLLPKLVSAKCLDA